MGQSHSYLQNMYVVTPASVGPVATVVPVAYPTFNLGAPEAAFYQELNANSLSLQDLAWDPKDQSSAYFGAAYKLTNNSKSYLEIVELEKKLTACFENQDTTKLGALTNKLIKVFKSDDHA